MPDGLSVSVFFPCYHDWGTMGSMVLMTMHTAEKLGLDYDITVVDDGSGPQTLALLEEVAQRLPNVRVVRHEKNKGYGGALRTGFASASKDWVFYTDGDAQYDVRELEQLVEHAGPDVDIVQGYKIRRSDPLHRVIVGRIYHWTVKIAFGLKLRDVDCDFRLIRRSVFDRVHLVSDTGIICCEMMTKFQRAGCRVKQVPVHHYHRLHGRSQFFNFKRLFRVAIHLTQLWWREVVVYHWKKGKDS